MTWRIVGTIVVGRCKQCRKLVRIKGQGEYIPCKRKKAPCPFQPK